MELNNTAVNIIEPWRLIGYVNENRSRIANSTTESRDKDADEECPSKMDWLSTGRYEHAFPLIRKLRKDVWVEKQDKTEIKVQMCNQPSSVLIWEKLVINKMFNKNLCFIYILYTFIWYTKWYYTLLYSSTCYLFAIY